MKRTLAAALLALTVAGCTPAQPTPTTVATTQDAPADTSGIVARFTNEIWPAITQYGPYQAAANRLRPVVDPNAGWQVLTDSIDALGGAGYDSATQTTSSRDDLHLVSANVTAVNDHKATVTACYSYTYSWYVNIADKKTEPRSSEASIELTNANNAWYLRAITNDHVVPSCQSSKA